MFRYHWTIIREHVDPSQSYHCQLIFTLHFGVAEACLYEVLGYVCISLSMCILRCYAWYRLYSPVDVYPTLLRLILYLVPSITAQDTNRQGNTDIT